MSVTASNSDGPLVVGQLIGGNKYRVVGLLSKGGMGALYVVQHTGFPKQFVLKAMLPELSVRRDMATRFVNEARALAALKHPGIVDVTDFGEEDGVHYLVMEKLEGADLAARLANGPLPIGLVVRIAAEMARAIGQAHAQKIIHRDLKPHNVFLAQEGAREVVKILDFGIAKLIEPSELIETLTTTSSTYGTVPYMSLEQLRSAKDVDERTDIYAIGVIMYQALTGALPYPGQTMGEVMFKVAMGEHLPVRSVRPEIPPALADIVARAMARDREHRFLSATELAQALEELDAGAAAESVSIQPSLPIARGLPTADTEIARPRATMRPDGREPRPPRPHPGRRWMIAAAGGAALATAVATLSRERTTTTRREPPPVASPRLQLASPADAGTPDARPAPRRPDAAADSARRKARPAGPAAGRPVSPDTEPLLPELVPRRTVTRDKVPKPLH